jgi:hypothetical protein
VKERHEYRRSGLFLVRVWAEASEEGDGSVEWYGKVQSVVDGRSREFQGENDLFKQLAAMLPNRDSVPGIDPTEEQAGQ